MCAYFLVLRKSAVISVRIDGLLISGSKVRVLVRPPSKISGLGCGKTQRIGQFATFWPRFAIYVPPPSTRSILLFAAVPAFRPRPPFPSLFAARRGARRVGGAGGRPGGAEPPAQEAVPGPPRAV